MDNFSDLTDLARSAHDLSQPRRRAPEPDHLDILEGELARETVPRKRMKMLQELKAMSADVIQAQKEEKAELNPLVTFGFKAVPFIAAVACVVGIAQATHAGQEVAGLFGFVASSVLAVIAVIPEKNRPQSIIKEYATREEKKALKSLPPSSPAASAPRKTGPSPSPL